MVFLNSVNMMLCPFFWFKPVRDQIAIKTSWSVKATLFCQPWWSGCAWCVCAIAWVLACWLVHLALLLGVVVLLVHQLFPVPPWHLSQLCHPAHLRHLFPFPRLIQPVLPHLLLGPTSASLGGGACGLVPSATSLVHVGRCVFLLCSAVKWLVISALLPHAFIWFPCFSQSFDTPHCSGSGPCAHVVGWWGLPCRCQRRRPVAQGNPQVQGAGILCRNTPVESQTSSQLQLPSFNIPYGAPLSNNILYMYYIYIYIKHTYLKISQWSTERERDIYIYMCRLCM